MGQSIFLIPVTVILFGLFSVALRNEGVTVTNLPVLLRVCEREEIKESIQAQCQQGAQDYGCTMQRLDSDFCTESSRECQGMFRRPQTIGPICARLCSLLNTSLPRPASRYWRRHIINTTHARLERQNDGRSIERMDLIEQSSVFKRRVYSFFRFIHNLSLARITYKRQDSSCNNEEFDADSFCSVNLRSDRRVRSLCGNETMSLCRREVRFDPNDHCSREYRCDRLTESHDNNNERGYCGRLCWVFENAFMDFPHGNHPYIHTKYDFQVIIKGRYRNGSLHDTTNDFVDVGLENARTVVYSLFSHGFHQFVEFDIRIRVASRYCYNENPPICRDNDYTRYQAGKVMFYPTFAGCYLPTRLDPDFEADLPTVPFSTECSVLVECGFGHYYREHGWNRMRWCYSMDWLFQKSFRWLGLQPSRAESSNMTASFTVFAYGLRASDNEVTTYNRSFTGPMRWMHEFFEEFVHSKGYFAHKFAIYAAFNNCLSESLGEAKPDIQGTDHCEDTDFAQIPTDYHDLECDYHRYTVGHTVHTVTDSCRFLHDMEQTPRKCQKLHLMFHRLVSEESGIGSTFYLKMVANVSSGYQTTRILSPIRRDTVLPFIKNFVTANFTSLTRLRFEYNSI